MEIFQRITDLFVKKQKINKEILTLQNSCNHNKKSIKIIREHVDSTSPVIRWVCDECLLPIRYPNTKEIEDFLKQ